MRERLLIIGNGMASVRLVEELLSRAPGRFAITIVGDELQPGYNRILLSALLAGDIDEEALVLRDRDWYRALGIGLLTGQRVAAVCSSRNVARLEDGTELAFDACVFATGSSPLRLPLPGAELPGVTSFRNRADIDAMQAVARAGGRVAVIGGGLLGVEAACGLAGLGAGVTLVHVTDRLMERQLDAKAAALLKTVIERKGIGVLLDRQTRAVAGNRRVSGLVFADGDRIEADLVVMAVGTRPQAGLAAAAGIGVNRGILVDDRLQTTLPGYHAIGECAEHRGIVHGLVEPACEQAAVLARQLAGDGAAAYGGIVPAASLNVSGMQVYSAGDFLGGPGTQSITYEESSPARYRRLVLREGRLAGAVLFGDAADGPWYRDLIREGADISRNRSDLIFGRSFAQSAAREAA